MISAAGMLSSKLGRSEYSQEFRGKGYKPVEKIRNTISEVQCYFKQTHRRRLTTSSAGRIAAPFAGVGSSSSGRGARALPALGERGLRSSSAALRVGLGEGEGEDDWDEGMMR